MSFVFLALPLTAEGLWWSWPLLAPPLITAVHITVCTSTPRVITSIIIIGIITAHPDMYCTVQTAVQNIPEHITARPSMTQHTPSSANLLHMHIHHCLLPYSIVYCRALSTLTTTCSNPMLCSRSIGRSSSTRSAPQTARSRR